MTQIIDRHSNDVPRTHPGFRILDNMAGLVKTKKGERLTTAAPGRIYALSSGMMSEYTVSNDFAYHFIDNPKNAVLFVGYADPDSPGGHLRRAALGDDLEVVDIDAAHMIYWEQPEAAAAEIRRFLS
jgi:pimeloyl-ACP methyl ester carboxylesterase